MATFLDLNGSFRSLAYTLQNRWSFHFSQAVDRSYRDQMASVSDIGRDSEAWSRLPDEDATYDRIVEQMDAAARALASAARTDDGEMLGVLRIVASALASLDARLRS